MKIRVRMIAFMEGEIREVEIPDDTVPASVLDTVFHYGQNDFQPQPDRCSVSVCDVIEWDNTLFMVAPFGFTEITEQQFAELKALPRRDRQFKAYEFDTELVELPPTPPATPRLVEEPTRARNIVRWRKPD